MKVEIWSDIACPWCYVAKRRFETALTQFEHRDELEVIWRSFQLDPEAPAERPPGESRHRPENGGPTDEQARLSRQQIAATAARDGLTLRLDIARIGNTFDAHRLVQLAGSQGRQDAVMERMMRASLTEGECMADHATLARLSAEAGLPEDDVHEVLTSDRHADAVREDQRAATALGVTGVPCFLVDGKFGTTGAQPPEALWMLLEHGWQEH